MLGKKLTALMLAMGLTVSIVAGCGNSEGAADTNTDANTAADDGAEDVADAGDEEEEDEDEDDETKEIVVGLMCFAPMDGSQTDAVEEALNEMLLEKINVQADFQWYDAVTYSQTIPMMIQANEQLDLMMFTPVPAAGYQSFMSQNQLMDITDLLPKYAPDIMDYMAEYLPATSKNGRVYGVGNMQALNGFAGIFMRKDMLEALDLVEAAENMTSWDDYKDILTQIVANNDVSGIGNSDAEGSVITPMPFLLGGDTFADAKWIDCVGDSYQTVYADPETNKIVSVYETEEWYNTAKRAKEWYDAGLIYKDAANAQDYASTLIRNGVSFSIVKGGESGATTTFSAEIGTPGLIVPVTSSKVSTGSFQKFGFGVPVTAREPEAALKLLNLLHSDPEVLNTLTWGVEGRDWVMKEDGTAAYPEGVTGETVLYHTADFLYGNKLICAAWEGEGADVRERQAAENEAMERSKFLGFSVSTDEVAETIANVKMVVDQYKPGLMSGSVDDVDAAYKAMIDGMYAAGFQDILDNYQAQLDAWLAEN